MVEPEVIMTDQNQPHRNRSPDEGTPLNSFWKSKSGMALLAFLAIIGFLLVLEHSDHILNGDGFLVGLLIVCVVVHLFMHGGHGGHGGHRDSDTKPFDVGRK